MDKNGKQEDNIYKLLLVGEGGVGKTSLTKQFVYSRFDDKYLKTLGTNISTKDLTLSADLGSPQVHLQIWDVLGQKGFQSIIKSAFGGAQGVIFVCDLSDLGSFEKLTNWINYAYEYGPEASFVFLGNKSDLPDHKFGLEDLKRIAGPLNAPAFLTSARNGEHVEEAFLQAATSIYTMEFAPPKDKVKLAPVDHGTPSDQIKAEDRIIAAFCREAGGVQVSMPIVRQHFQKHGIDFENPSRDDLKQIIISLSTYLKFIKGEDVAKEYARGMKRVLKDMNMF